jgi:signal transduction histidine kinase
MRAPFPTSLRGRLTALVAVTGSALVLAASLGASLVLTSQLDAAVDAGLAERATDVASAWRPGSQGLLADPFAQVVRADGTVAARSAAAPADPMVPAAALTGLPSAGRRLEVSVPALRGPARVLARPSRGAVVVVAAPLDVLDAAQGRLRSALAAALLGMLVILTAGTWWVVGAALRPVGRMSRVADDLIQDPTHLTPLPVPAGGDELARLARTLNRLLVALSDAVARERAMVDDASHELRTPLTVLRGELELTVDERDPERQRQGVERALGEVERLSALAEDLLVLARETGGTERPRTPITLLSWLRQIVAHHVPPALDVRVDGDGARVSADPAALERVVANVLRNAATAGARGVDVHVVVEGPDAVLRVHDDGPGFPPDSVDHVFDRFFRAEPSSGAGPPPGSSGTGLGLAIVRAVIDAHGGTVRAANAPDGGALVEIRLPVL